MNEMLSLMARALHQVHYTRGRGLPPAWETLDRFEKEMWITSASTAMETMKHYTFDMEQAGMAAMARGEPFELVWNTAINVGLRRT